MTSETFGRDFFLVLKLLSLLRETNRDRGKQDTRCYRLQIHDARTFKRMRLETKFSKKKKKKKKKRKRKQVESEYC